MTLYRTLWRRVAGAVLAVALGACGGLGPAASPVPAVTVTTQAGVPLAFAHQGERGHAPTVVFQSGLGDDHGTWAPVLRRLPAAIEAIAPDRPGYGASPARDNLRDACQIAIEQRQLLHGMGASPPYLLVGHSIGGLYQYVFARMFPREVAGLVLLDATHPRLLDTLQRENPGAAALLQVARHTVFTPVMRQEFDAQTSCLAAVERAAPLAVPALVLTSTRPPFYAGAQLQATLQGLQDDWVTRTGAAQRTPVAGSGHVIQRDAPAAVVQAIVQLAGPAPSP